MPGLFVDAELEPDEKLRFRRVCLLHRGRRTIGGEVNVTDRRLVFVPNRLEQLVGATPIAVALDAIEEGTFVPAPLGSERFRFLARTPRPRALIDAGETTLALSFDDAASLLELVAPPTDD